MIAGFVVVKSGLRLLGPWPWFVDLRYGYVLWTYATAMTFGPFDSPIYKMHQILYFKFYSHMRAIASSKYGP